eukprot:1446832-Pleurochrysis_carterae.AAC.1
MTRVVTSTSSQGCATAWRSNRSRGRDRWQWRWLLRAWSRQPWCRPDTWCPMRASARSDSAAARIARWWSINEAWSCSLKLSLSYLGRTPMLDKGTGERHTSAALGQEIAVSAEAHPAENVSAVLLRIVQRRLQFVLRQSRSSGSRRSGCHRRSHLSRRCSDLTG